MSNEEKYILRITKAEEFIQNLNQQLLGTEFIDVDYSDFHLYTSELEKTLELLEKQILYQFLREQKLAQNLDRKSKLKLPKNSLL